MYKINFISIMSISHLHFVNNVSSISPEIVVFIEIDRVHEIRLKCASTLREEAYMLSI